MVIEAAVGLHAAVPVSTKFSLFVPLVEPIITSLAFNVNCVPLITLFMPVAVIVSGALVVSGLMIQYDMYLIHKVYLLLKRLILSCT